MAQYYYTAAALPMLSFDGPLPMRIDDFLTFCRDTINLSDVEVLEKISRVEISEAYSHQDEECWRLWEMDLRNALVAERAVALGWGIDSKRTDSYSYAASVIAKSALSGESPMAVEIALDEARWRFAEDLGIGHYFDTIFLISYCLKLTILERRAKLTLERGTEAYKRIYETTLESLNVGDADGE